MTAYKLEGETPLECLERARRDRGILVSTPMTYAGRLDPMAEGAMLILVGDECKNKDGYLGLDKEYEVEVLFGIGSDTGDILGLVEIAEGRFSDAPNERIKEKAAELVGKRTEKYPMYSSKPFKGKPLFAWAKESAVLTEEDIPEKEIEIYSVEFLGSQMISLADIVFQAEKRIALVKGDFRQDQAVDSWKGLLKAGKEPLQSFEAAKLKIKASSGSYMRTLAVKLGALLGTKALAWRIVRTKIGEYEALQS